MAKKDGDTTDETGAEIAPEVPPGETPGEPQQEEGQAPALPPGIVPGRIVYFTPWEHDAFTLAKDEPGIVAIITRTFGGGTVNLRLFCDGEFQNPRFVPEVIRSCAYNADGEPGTWRFLR